MAGSGSLQNPPYAGLIRRLSNTWKDTNGTWALILEIATQFSQGTRRGGILSEQAAVSSGIGSARYPQLAYVAVDKDKVAEASAHHK